MKMTRLLPGMILLSVFFYSCEKQGTDQPPLKTLLKDSPSIEGKPEYLKSPFVTAGNRVYMVGHQDGSFPELGWHITGEMGGVWDHPIKLMDGFHVDLVWEGEERSLDSAQSFTNYPMANQHFYSLQDKGIDVERWQFVPDNKEGLVVQYLITNKSDVTQEFDLKFTGSADLRPTWLAERQQISDHQDQAVFDDDLDAWVVRDSLNPWFVVYGADLPASAHNTADYAYSGKGVANSLGHRISLGANESQAVSFVIAGSYESRDNAVASYEDIKKTYLQMFKDKRDRYQALAERSKLTIPDKKVQEAFEWLKYNCDWMVRTVPEIGTGMGAGIPDYPWWFGADSEYALKGYMAVGQSDIVYKTIHLLDSLSEVTNGNGRIVHEVSTNGVVFNPGNINETPQFISLIWDIYQWNGDDQFLKKYFPTVKKGLHWLITEKDANKNLFPDGFGMMEIHGMDSEMIDVAAYTQKAFDDASKMAKELGEDSLAASYEATAATLKKRINEEFWSEEFQSYADFIGTDEQALHLIEGAIVRADTLKKPWAVAELKKTKEAILQNPSDEPRPFVVHHNWVVNTPVEVGLADQEKAIKALNTAEKFTNPFGMFVTGIDRDESAGADEGSFKGSKVFSYTGAVMTLPTGVQAVAEANYGRSDEALNYIKRMTRTFSFALPGSMYEVSPDYGMISQAWNIYGFAVPIVTQFFGIKPQAVSKQVVVRPQMPEEWPEASLENVAVADNSVSVYYSEENGLLKLRVVQTNPEWTVRIELPAQKDDVTYELEESSVEGEPAGDSFVFTSSELQTEITLKYN